MQREEAERVALEALAYVAGDADLLPVFQGATGTSLEDMKIRAEESDFLLSVLEFLAMDDQWIIGFCDAHGLAYDTPMRAMVALPGGTAMHWT